MNAGVFERLVELFRRRRLAEAAGGELSWTAGYWEGRIDEYAIQAGVSAEQLVEAKERAQAEPLVGAEGSS